MAYQSAFLLVYERAEPFTALHDAFMTYAVPASVAKRVPRAALYGFADLLPLALLLLVPTALVWLHKVLLVDPAKNDYLQRLRAKRAPHPLKSLLATPEVVVYSHNLVGAQPSFIVIHDASEIADADGDTSGDVQACTPAVCRGLSATLYRGSEAVVALTPHGASAANELAEAQDGQQTGAAGADDMVDPLDPLERLALELLLRTTCMLYRAVKMFNSRELYHDVIRWLLVLVVIPTAAACATIEGTGASICALRKDKSNPCQLLSIWDKLGDLWSALSNHWLVVVLLQIGQSVQRPLQSSVTRAVRKLMRVLEDQKQAQKFKNNEFDDSTLNISLNMLRKVDTVDGVDRYKLTYATLLEEPLAEVIRDKHVRNRIIRAAHMTTDQYAFLHTLAYEENYGKMMSMIVNRISMAFSKDQLTYEADASEERVTMRRFWIGICSEKEAAEVRFARKLRVFMASEALLESLIAGDEDEDGRPDAAASGGESARRSGSYDERFSSPGPRFRGMLRMRSHKLLSLPLQSSAEDSGRSGSDEGEPTISPLPAQDPFVSKFDKFCLAKSSFLKNCKEGSVDVARQTPECEKVASELGFMPHFFIEGERVKPRMGLKRWQTIVEMAFIYAEGHPKTRGGGLLRSIDLPVAQGLGGGAQGKPAMKPA